MFNDAVSYVLYLIVLSIFQTPARNLQDHVSTGHANSPVTIDVGKAYQEKVVQPTGAPPRLVHDTAPFKNNMTMEEDLTGNYFSPLLSID